MTEDEAKLVCALFIKELSGHTRELSVAMDNLAAEVRSHTISIHTVQVNLDTVKNSLDVLSKVVRDGDQGAPGLTTRMAIAERNMIALNELFSARENNKKFNWTLIVAIICGVLGLLGGAIGAFK